MDRKELLVAYTKRLWMANTANDITGLLLDYEKDLKLIEERELVKNCSIPDVVGQSEQLKAFVAAYNEEMDKVDPYYSIPDDFVDEYLKSL